MIRTGKTLAGRKTNRQLGKVKMWEGVGGSCTVVESGKAVCGKKWGVTGSLMGAFERMNWYNCVY